MREARQARAFVKQAILYERCENRHAWVLIAAPAQTNGELEPAGIRRSGRKAAPTLSEGPGMWTASFRMGSRLSGASTNECRRARMSCAHFRSVFELAEVGKSK